MTVLLRDRLSQLTKFKPFTDQSDRTHLFCITCGSKTIIALSKGRVVRTDDLVAANADYFTCRECKATESIDE